MQGGYRGPLHFDKLGGGSQTLDSDSILLLQFRTGTSSNRRIVLSCSKENAAYTCTRSFTEKGTVTSKKELYTEGNAPCAEFNSLSVTDSLVSGNINKNGKPCENRSNLPAKSTNLVDATESGGLFGLVDFNAQPDIASVSIEDIQLMFNSNADPNTTSTAASILKSKRKVAGAAKPRIAQPDSERVNSKDLLNPNNDDSRFSSYILPEIGLEFYYISDQKQDLKYENSLFEQYKLANTDWDSRQSSNAEWIQEQYESDASKYFEKYSAFAQADPDCLVRYQFGGKPLWFTKKERIPPCANCGAARVFEFQLMASCLLAFGVDGNGMDMDWGTVLVFVCQADCMPKNSVYVNEHVIVQ